MKIDLTTRQKQQLRKASVIGAVVLAHGGVFLMMGRTQTIPLQPQLPTILVELVEPAPPPPEDPPPPTPSPVAGGGAPAAPSRVNIVPDPPEDIVPEIIAPPVQAPEPDPIIVGAAPIASPTPGMGQGGQGTGTGSGIGDGSGPGSGGGTPPRLLVGPTTPQLRAVHPPAALRAGRSGRAALRCRIRLDTRLEACRVVDETPQGQGFGEAALRASTYFRFRPPTENGRPVGGRELTVGVEFGRQR